MSSKNYEADGYMHGLDLLIILHQLHASCPTKSGCLDKSIHLRHIFLMYDCHAFEIVVPHMHDCSLVENVGFNP